ncbi:MAG TPA: zinc-binding dehydrogenase, partial [Anaerolineales bacterium]|nr:zinc-binding dehydrogenase [Anaerolineales bacterium]
EYCLAGFDNRCQNWQLLGETRPGTYAEVVVVPAQNLYRLPPGFDPQRAAAAALVFQTAWHSLITRGRLRPGERVLVVGASGGVNTACIQIAKLSGAQVYVVGSNRAKLELAETLGADFLIDRSIDPDWSKAVYKQTGKQGVDVVVDNVGTTFLQSMRAARKGGRILTVGNTGGPHFEFDNRYMFAKHLALIGSTMSTQMEFRQVMSLIFAGRLHPVMDRAFPLAEARAAHEYLESGAQMGKVTLSIIAG